MIPEQAGIHLAVASVNPRWIPDRGHAAPGLTAKKKGRALRGLFSLPRRQAA
jgi:hypothetical protein